jgi:outer membrane protein OmpA-like peptidoglycan-associated protein
MFPTIADDGVLYFSSDSRTGLGGLDVYSSTFTNGEWANVDNLGAPINSNADDFGFIINSKNENGYFISNRAGGVGDDDIYKFKKSGINICGTVVDAKTKELLPASEVKLFENETLLDTKATGGKGDFCFLALPNKSYKITATKADYENGSLNITTKKANEVVQIPLAKLGGIDLTVCVTQVGKGTLVGATVTLTNKATGEKKTCTITADCKCKFDLEPNTDYEICATKDAESTKGSFDKPCKSISTKGKVAPASIYETIEMTYLEENMVIKIENLYYDLNKWNIRPDAAIEMNKVVVLMQKFPAMEIELSSHTDCRAPMKYNDDLSTKRAKSCVDYLITNGISSTRMIAAGYGERRLVNKCACEGNVKSTCTDAQHQENRRTEFKILKLK